MSEQELKVKALEAAAQTCHDFHDMMLKAKEIFTWLTSEVCMDQDAARQAISVPASGRFGSACR